MCNLAKHFLFKREQKWNEKRRKNFVIMALKLAALKSWKQVSEQKKGDRKKIVQKLKNGVHVKLRQVVSRKENSTVRLKN